MNKTDVINIIKEKLQNLLNFYSAKKYEEVINKGLPLLKKNPQLNILSNLISLSYHNLGEHDKAIVCLEKALQSNSKDISVLNNLGLVHTSIENYEEAENYYKKAISLNPKLLSIFCFALSSTPIWREAKVSKLWSISYWRPSSLIASMPTVVSCAKGLS